MAEVEPLVVYLDAIYLTTRPSAVKERVRVGGRYDAGERVLLDICLGLKLRGLV